jgi:hypothetical protein
MSRSRMMGAAVICTVVLSGCGDGMLTPKGRVVKSGEPIVLKPGEDLGVFFYPLGSDGKLGTTVYPALFHAADSSFRVTGSDRRGMPPGKYRVAVELKLNKKDLFKGAYDMTNSPFVIDVDSKTREIVIDLDKAKGG